MPLPTNSRQSGWHQGHVPRLSYRNAIPQADTLASKELTIDTTSGTRTGRPGLSIREIREALPQSPQGNSPSPVSPAYASNQRSKKSFLGGLFAKEPSMAALDQVTQQMIAQHGSISPTVIPHVSSQKMPDHVPKVNSKWDGVPDHIKMREKADRERARYSIQETRRPANTRTQSSGIQEDQYFTRKRKSNAASTTDTWDSRSTGSRPMFHDDVADRAESIYSASSGDSINHNQRPPPSINSSQGFTYNAPSSDTSIYMIDETPIMLRGSRPQLRSIEPFLDGMAVYTLQSTVPTPIERSPKTPTPLSEEENSIENFMRDQSAKNSSVMKGKPASSAIGRAVDNPRGGSQKATTRVGLGERTNSVVAPWETQVPTTEALSNTTPTKSRGKARFFSKEKK